MFTPEQPSRIAGRARHRRLAACLVTAGMLAGPAAASARPTLSADRPCYPEHAPMRFTGGGFTPGAGIAMLFAANGHLGTLDLTADATGAVTDTVRSPKLSDFGAKPPRFDLDVTANDQSKFLPDGTIVGPPEDSFAFAKVTVSDWDVMVKSWDTNGPAHGKPQRRISLKAYGWTLDGSTLFAHYLRSGHVLRTVKVGSLAPPCGDLSTMMREFPFRPVPAGRYRVVFDASRVYSPAVANVYYSSVVVARKDAVR